VTAPTEPAYDDIARGLAPFHRNVLLTGAGFSKPLGGYLVSEFWSALISDQRLRASIEVDRILHDGCHFNFEEALAKTEVTDKQTFNDTDRKILRDCVLSTFASQELLIGHAGPDVIGPLRDLLAPFLSQTNATSCLFTLNQDSAVERYLLTGDAPRILVPGVARDPMWFGGQSPSAPSTEPFKTVPLKQNDYREEFGGIRGRLSYLKLHGSATWLDNDKNVVVLGGAKKEMIDAIPILRMNNTIFREALMTAPEPRLLVIGYGFGDDHINEIIQQAVTGNRLRIWIFDPTSPEGLFERIAVKNRRGSIWKAVVGHSTMNWTDIRRRGGLEWKQICTTFLGG
jgi:hypothetical protein